MGQDGGPVTGTGATVAARFGLGPPRVGDSARLGGSVRDAAGDS